MRSKNRFLFSLTVVSIFFCTLFADSSYSQQTWSQDFRNMMEIPAVTDVESSPAHMYVLSEREGLAVFRTNADTLQWLYTSEGMQRRGNRLQADIRFAYLLGDSRRLTVVEPTSVLGVYSSTVLPARPLAVQRLGNSLYIAMGDRGLGTLSLESPDELDSDPEMLFADELDGSRVIDLASDLVSQIYLLTDNRTLFVIGRDDSGESVEIQRSVSLDKPIERLFLTGGELIGTDGRGEVHLISSDGSTRSIAYVASAVDRVRVWDENIAIRTGEGKLWIGEFGSQPELWKEDPEAGNYVAAANGSLWVTDHERFAPVIRVEQETGDSEHARADVEPGLRAIDNVTIPFPRPVIIPLELTSNHNPEEIDFSYRSNIENARIRGQSLYWQPAYAQIGRNQFTVTATTSAGRSASVDFTVIVRPFNTPPRFTPVQDLTISVDEEFEFEINAVDPDGMDPELIRYLGVDLPQGASLNEQTGEFNWSPTIRQVGDHTFQVIATDQFGAATSKDINIRVIETDPDAEADIDN